MALPIHIETAASKLLNAPGVIIDMELAALRDTDRTGVLIPAYNEEPVMDATIDSLLIAGFAKADIYIVDDLSSDRTAEIAHARGVNVYTVPVNGGKALAQIQALEYFNLLKRYTWMIFLDGDTKIDPNFLNAMKAAAAKDPTAGLFLGQVKSVKNSHIFSASRAFDYTYGQEVNKIGQHNFNVVFVAPGCASMYKTEVLSKLQIDHMTLAEDMDLTMQMHRAGGRVAYVPDAIVNTQDPGTFKDYHKQTLRWYRGYWQVVLKHQVLSIFKKKQRVDWYMIMLSADAIIFNRILWLGILAYAISWTSMFVALGIDIGTAFTICFYCAWKTRRFDVLWKFPAYYWFNYLNFYAYMRSFIEIIIQRKELLAWNKVKRYNFDDPSSAKKTTIVQ